jgi:NADH-quinone oxidoreductase subunit A
VAYSCVGSSPIVGTNILSMEFKLISSVYFPIVLFMLLAMSMGGLMILAGRVLGRHNPDSEKNSPYECGFEAFSDARIKFDVRYYLIAILFILFDLEIAFLFPWALVFKVLGFYGFIVMAVFLAILIAGFIYVWKKGALEWE